MLLFEKGIMLLYVFVGCGKLGIFKNILCLKKSLFAFSFLVSFCFFFIVVDSCEYSGLFHSFLLFF